MNIKKSQKFQKFHNKIWIYIYIYIYPEERGKIIDNLRWIIIVYNGISKNNKLARQYTKLPH